MTSPDGPLPIFVAGESNRAHRLRQLLSARAEFELIDLKHHAAPRLGLVELDAAHEASPEILGRAFPGTGLIVFGALFDDEEIARAMHLAGKHRILEFIPVSHELDEAGLDAWAEQQLFPRMAALLPELAKDSTQRTSSPTLLSMQEGSSPRAANRDRSRLDGRFDICAIGASAGGPRALSRLLELLPAQLNGSILIAQHMPPRFTTQLAAGLDARSALTVVEAGQGMPVERGHVYIAPGEAHMLARRSQDRIYLQCVEGPPHHYCRPSIDLLFRSLVEVIPTRTLAVLMTGMGDDGCEGIRELRAAKAHTMAQNEASSTVFGIPARAIEAGLIDEIYDIEGLAERITTYLGVYDSRTAEHARD